MAKYMALFNLSSEAISRFVVSPSDRAEVVRHLVESVGGSLECYYWMFGQYDGMAVFEVRDAHTTVATSLAITGSGAFTHFETHELIEAGDLIRDRQASQRNQVSAAGRLAGTQALGYIPGASNPVPRRMELNRGCPDGHRRDGRPPSRMAQAGQARFGDPVEE